MYKFLKDVATCKFTFHNLCIHYSNIFEQQKYYCYMKLTSLEITHIQYTRVHDGTELSKLCKHFDVPIHVFI